MENFRFFVPTDIRFGRDRLSELPEALAKFGKRVLVVYGVDQSSVQVCTSVL